jgi:hypothetical protein
LTGWLEPTYISALLAILIVYGLSRFIYPEMTFVQAIPLALGLVGLSTLTHRSAKNKKRGRLWRYNRKLP